MNVFYLLCLFSFNLSEMIPEHVTVNMYHPDVNKRNVEAVLVKLFY